MKYFWHAIVGVVLTFSLAAGYGALYDPYAPSVPGSTNPQVTQATIKQTICVPGWTATIRPPSSYTTALKIKQLPKGADPKLYEEDHAISLELGGAPTDPKNLWPQKYDPRPGAHEKDIVETYLKKAVCADTMTLAEAQKEVLNWYIPYQRIHTGFGAVSVDASDTDD